MASGAAGAALTLDKLYFGTHPNYANSPLPAVTMDLSGAITRITAGTGLRKFVDPLPTIPVAVPDTITFPGSDYYEIGLEQYRQQMHTDLPATTLRGYVQLNNGTDLKGANTVSPPATPQYLGPMIVAQRDRPVRVKFTNMLATGSGGNLFIPVDTTVMGAGMNMNNGAPYQQNRANIHLHGGNTPWISDGTPHQWTVPKGDSATNQRGDSVQFVPDMFFDGSGNVVAVPPCDAVGALPAGAAHCWPNLVSGLTNDPGQGSMTFYYTNQQSARLMFYHDHSYGITRLNVYAGEAAAYVLRDPVEAQLMANGVIPQTEIPLVIQDRTFVPANPATAPVYSVPVLAPGSGYSLATTKVAFVNGSCTSTPVATPEIGDTSDGFGTVNHAAIVGITLNNGGSCSTPPDVTIVDSGSGRGAVAFASLATLAQQDPTWIWGTGSADGVNGNGDLWFPHTYMTNQWPDNPDGSSMNAMGRWDYGMWFWPPMTISLPGAGGLVHGSVPCATTAKPKQTCPGFPTTILPAVGGMGAGSVASLTPEAFMDTPVVNGMAYPTVTVPAGAVRFRILNASNDRSLNLSLFAADPSVTTLDLRKNTEVKMVPAASTSGWSISWPTDGRDGGVPDPATAGPSWIQIGNEAGFIPYPVVIPPTPVGYEYARRSITVTNVSYKSLFLGAAERADVIVDFSAFAGQTLIVYNDAPAPTPAYDPRYDYYTGDPDMTGMGGAPTTLAGFGPNTRTVMQIVVEATAGTTTPANLGGLQAQLPAAFSVAQPVPLVPEAVYGSVYGQSYPNTYLRLQDYTTSFTPIGATAPVPFTLLDKTIQELFELDYGRMNATLGTELPLTNYTTQTTIPLGYVDPPTELLTDSRNVSSQPVGVTGDGTQIWKITHNGVDTHSVHFHLFNVQLINRIGWDGTNRPPDPNELGWKETVRMNPLEIEFVALRPMSQNLPWPLPDSVRLMDVTMPAGKDTAMTLLSATGIPANQQNQLANFGWEYVWHCHLLGHEENDMMRAMVLQVPPEAPANLLANANSGTVILSWVDKSASETEFIVERDTDPMFAKPVLVKVVTPHGTLNAMHQGTDWGSTIIVEDPLSTDTTYYRVKAVNASAYPSLGAPTTLNSQWSNTASVGSAPTIGIAPTVLAFGSLLVGSTTAAQTIPISVSNTGAGTLVLGPLAIVGLNPGDFAASTTCSGPIVAVTGTCTISVTFMPTAAGSRIATLSFTTNDPLNMQPSISLSGTGMEPALSLAPLTVTFGNQMVKTTSTPAQTILLSNKGTAPLVIKTIGLGGANAVEFAFTHNCGSLPITLSIGGSCSISLTFTPAASGLRSASLDVVAASPASSQSVTLQGTGIIADATLAPTTLSFVGQVVNTTSTSQTVMLTNPGLAPLTIAGIVIGGANSSDFTQSTTCGATLPAGLNCTISVVFKPTARGSRIATLVVSDNATPATQSVGLSGTGLAPIVSVIPAPLVFGVQVIATPSAPQTLILANSGDAPLLISSILVSGANVSEFVLVANSCPLSLAALASCAMDVVFTPTTSAARSASLVVTSSDPINPVLSIPISGTGTALALSPTALSFGSQTVGTSSSTRTVTITNAGVSVLSINSIALAGTTPTDYTMNNQCGTTLRAGRSCTVGLRFSPAASGVSSASLVVDTSDPAAPQAQVALSGAGLAPALGTSATALTFSSSVNTSSPSQQIVVSNIGQAPLTMNGITLGGTNSGQFSQNNNCPLGTSLPVGATCTINVTFTPNSATPLSMSQTLSINVAAPATSQSIALTGSVIVPTYSVSPASIVFPNQAIRTTSPAQAMTITNTGTVSLLISNVSISGTGTNQFAQTSNCGTSAFRPFPATLVAGASCTIQVTFRPRTAVASTAALSLSVGGGATPAQTQVPLSGVGQ